MILPPPPSNRPSLLPLLFLVAFLLLIAGCAKPPEYDFLLRGGLLFDGSGAPPRIGDVAICGDTIAAVGDLGEARAVTAIDITGLALSPGFINMLSQASETLIEDGLSRSDIFQGVTLEVLGEGWSGGPLNDGMRRKVIAEQGEVKYGVQWKTLGGYLRFLEERGVSCNIASFVGHTSVRVHELGYENRAPTGDELHRMKVLVDEAMRQGALGLSSALVYAPASYSETGELVELARVASGRGGIYASHIRSEGDRLLAGIDELIAIAREAEIPAVVHHLKAMGEANWDKLSGAIERIERARSEGLEIAADQYVYAAAWTGLDATMPPWVQEGGNEQWFDRLDDPAVRERLIREIADPEPDWENFFAAAGGADRIMLTGFRSEALRPFTGMTLAEIAALRAATPVETLIDLVREDRSRVGAVYFLMSEENVRRKIALPWAGFSSDERSLAPEGHFLQRNVHPRAYGNFARLLGHYVRDEKLITLSEAIRRLTSFPADILGIKKRGMVEIGHFADLVVFDPERVADHATWVEPHQLSSGVIHLFVNGVPVVLDGEHTLARPGRTIRGPGFVPAEP